MNSVGLWGLAALVMSCAGFLAFGMTTRRHYEAKYLASSPAGLVRRLRTTAWTLLILAAVCAFLDQGPIFGPVLWSGTVMIGAALVFLTLNRTQIFQAEK
ncbi:MAG: DUF3325 domain-containing protein [Erythrobacter sp.]|nr:DUF3325 domain-containing protein [Erythrobacter sp.]